MGRLFDELKRRNVFRVAIAYLVASWLVMQVADLILENIGAPEWVMQVFMFVLALGFPFVLVFSWVYEITPEGVKREKDVDRDRSITPDTGRKLDMATIGMLVGVLFVVGVERFMYSPDHGIAPGQADAGAEATTDGKSIAVLAFDDLSPAGDQAYFARGLSEELLNVLAQVADLKVAGRTSSFAFSGTDKTIREIGEILNVEHVLEGSVRKAGDRIRVTAQLIKASTGYHLFSATYDRDLEDIFAVQDEIAGEISNALLSEIVGTESVSAVTATDPEAYELYLLARQRIHTRDPLALREASTMLDSALEIAPDYPPALAQKALATYLLSDSLGAYGDIPAAEAVRVGSEYLERAFREDPDLAEAHAIKGLLLTYEYRYDEGVAELERALDINPTYSDAANWLANSYGYLQRRDDARQLYEAVVERDPLYGPAFSNLVIEYTRTGAFDKAESLISRVERIVGRNDEVLQAYGTVNIMRGEAATAATNLGAALEENPNATVVKMWLGFALFSLADYESLVESGIGAHRIAALAIQGYIDEAIDEMYSYDWDSGFPPRAIKEMGHALLPQGMHREYIDFVEARFGTIDVLLDRYSPDQSWGVSYLPELAYAYRRIGDEATYERLLAEIPGQLDADLADGADNWLVRYGDAQYAALTGDTDRAIESLRATFDKGYSYLRGYESPIFDVLDEDPRYQSLLESVRRKVDSERAKLGMPPYRPVSITDDDKDEAFVN